MTALFLFFCKKIYPRPDFLPKNYNSLKFWGLFTHSEPTYHLRGSPYAVRLPPPWEGDQGGGAATRQYEVRTLASPLRGTA